MAIAFSVWVHAFVSSKKSGNKLYLVIMSRTCFRVYPHFMLAWMSRNSLLEPCSLLQIIESFRLHILISLKYLGMSSIFESYFIVKHCDIPEKSCKKQKRGILGGGGGGVKTVENNGFTKIILLSITFQICVLSPKIMMKKDFNCKCTEKKNIYIYN